MVRVNYRDWVFDCDVDATRNAYAGKMSGGAAECACAHCKNFLATRPGIFPNEIVTLFTDLGIDEKKEAESYYIASIKRGMHQYGAWYHFVGQIVRQRDSPVSFDEHNSIDFMVKEELASESFKALPLVQLELRIAVPWMLDPSLEPK